MPAALLPKEEVLERLAAAFRRYGYDGASIARLSAATGLGKASLYHYFKGGKQEMAEAVMAHVGGRFGELVLEPLRSDAAPPHRLNQMILGLDAFYHRGNASCILDLFGIGSAGELFRPQLKGAIDHFRNAISRTLEQAGLDSAVAVTRAEDAIVAIQGSLVISRATGSRDAFRRVLAELPARLLSPP
jgi:AcrR family transcriptional regulator